MLENQGRSWRMSWMEATVGLFGRVSEDVSKEEARVEMRMGKEEEEARRRYGHEILHRVAIQIR